jgi:predicted RNase H-like nuclease (RuvC/YqgF family)
MALAKEDIEQIQILIRDGISERLLNQNANVRYELDLRERTIRVEEELKHQRELMLEGFKQMEKRFEQMEKRFEQADKRLEEMRIDMNKRFEQVDKRFEQVDKRFEQQHTEIMAIHNEIKLLMRWGFGTLLAIASLVVAVFRLAP